ncbi:MAG: hypothetical protein JXA46_08910 [Dehalococcoidales bacterium]|nr:hypothetical protein [Dehalococcoidales bacterium]
MWLFRRKKKETGPKGSVPRCNFCGSTNTMLHNYHGGDDPNPVRTWRGQRYLTCRCLDCGREFYIDEPAGGIPADMPTDEDMIDEDELRRAEEELKRQIDDEDDRMLR